MAQRPLNLDLWVWKEFLVLKSFPQLAQLYPWHSDWRCFASTWFLTLVRNWELKSHSQQQRRPASFFQTLERTRSSKADEKDKGLEGNPFVVSALVNVQGMLWRAKLVASTAIIPLGLHMTWLYVFPQPSFVLGGPQAVLTLPNIFHLGHLSHNFCLHI